MAPHSSTLVWRNPWTEEPRRLQSTGSLRVGHDWATSHSLFTFMHWRRKWQPTPVFLPGESQGRGSLVGCRLWGRTESDMTEATQQQQQQHQLFTFFQLCCGQFIHSSQSCCHAYLQVPSYPRITRCLIGAGGAGWSRAVLRLCMQHCWHVPGPRCEHIIPQPETASMTPCCLQIKDQAPTVSNY